MDMLHTVLENIRTHYEEMFSAEKKVADFILNNPEQAVNSNVSELAGFSNVSEATVIRMCKHAGYKGYYQLRLNLSHDLGRNKAAQIDSLEKPAGIQDVFQIMASNILTVGSCIDTDTLSICAGLIRQAKNVHMVAAGNTSPIATDFGFRLGRYGIRTTHSFIPEYYFNYISLGMEGDIVFAITSSGSSKQVIQAVELAKERKMPVIALTRYETSPITKLADYSLIAKTGKEIFNHKHYGPDSHLYEMAVIDVILYLINNEKTLDRSLKEIDDVELILSEYKL